MSSPILLFCFRLPIYQSNTFFTSSDFAHVSVLLYWICGNCVSRNGAENFTDILDCCQSLYKPSLRNPTGMQTSTKIQEFPFFPFTCCWT
jgi:hypothetical protein